MRRRLIEERTRFAASAEAAAAAEALGRELRQVLGQLEPQCLGLYWPQRSEFNAALAIDADPGLVKTPRALPFARRRPVSMEYRRWDGSAPTLRDECNIPASAGAVVVPDVVVVPCVGYTESGFRLGYGGGYFDRWLERHPHACAVGLAWQASRIDEAELAPQPHDLRMTLIVTEHGVV